jgi:hypothetical protein
MEGLLWPSAALWEKIYPTETQSNTKKIPKSWSILRDSGESILCDLCEKNYYRKNAKVLKFSITNFPCSALPDDQRFSIKLLYPFVDFYGSKKNLTKTLTP